MTGAFQFDASTFSQSKIQPDTFRLIQYVLKQAVKPTVNKCLVCGPGETHRARSIISVAHAQGCGGEGGGGGGRWHVQENSQGSKKTVRDLW